MLTPKLSESLMKQLKKAGSYGAAIRSPEKLTLCVLWAHEGLVEMNSHTAHLDTPRWCWIGDGR